jgi:HNH endonuclease
MARPRKSPVDYLVEDRGFETPCWIWLRGTNNGGYGITYENQQIVMAHRAYYERNHGLIPEGLDIDHLCRVRACVNPAHLEVVTRSVNVRRGLAAKLSDAEREEIRTRFAAGNVSQATLARDHHIDPSVVSLLVRDLRRPRSEATRLGWITRRASTA